MTIRRAPRPHQDYTIVRNAVLEDERLSFKAMGVLVYLLSKPDGWTANRAHLASTHTDGEDAVRSALRELRATGYITTEDERDATGRITGRAAVVHDQPQEADDPCGGKPTSRASRQVADPRVVMTEGSNDPNPARTDPPTPHGQLALAGGQVAPAAPFKAPRTAQAMDLVWRAFWEAYPRKAGKIAARRAWDKALRAGHDPAAIVAGARRYAADPNREDQYTAHPATWLNAGRWEDEAEPQRQQRAQALYGAAGTMAAYQEYVQGLGDRPLAPGMHYAAVQQAPRALTEGDQAAIAAMLAGGEG